MKVTTKILVILATILAVGTIGCGAKKSAEPTRTEIGKDMQKSGVMTETNYVRLRAQIDGIRATGKISDSDLDWSLSLLKQSRNVLAHTRIMTGLSILRQASPSQKAKITEALTPYLSSSELLDRNAAKRLQRALTKI